MNTQREEIIFRHSAGDVVWRDGARLDLKDADFLGEILCDEWKGALSLGLFPEAEAIRLKAVQLGQAMVEALKWRRAAGR